MVICPLRGESQQLCEAWETQRQLFYFAYYSYCRIHSSIRCTPAIESGLAGHVWSLRDLLPRNAYWLRGFSVKYAVINFLETEPTLYWFMLSMLNVEMKIHFVAYLQTQVS